MSNVDGLAEAIWNARLIDALDRIANGGNVLSFAPVIEEVEIRASSGIRAFESREFKSMAEGIQAQYREEAEDLLSTSIM